MKSLKVSVITLIAAGFLASCGGGSNFKETIDKLTDFQCRMAEQQIAILKNPEDQAAKDELKAIQDEMMAYSKELAEKNKGQETSPEEAKKAAEYMKEKREACEAIANLPKVREEMMKKAMEEAQPDAAPADSASTEAEVAAPAEEAAPAE